MTLVEERVVDRAPTLVGTVGTGAAGVVIRVGVEKPPIPC